MESEYRPEGFYSRGKQPRLCIKVFNFYLSEKIVIELRQLESRLGSSHLLKKA